MTDRDLEARNFDKYSREQLIENIETWDIRNYSKEELFQYLEENESCEVVDKAEVKDIIYSLLTDMRVMMVGNTVYFTKRQIDEMIKAYTGEEE